MPNDTIYNVFVNKIKSIRTRELTLFSLTNLIRFMIIFGGVFIVTAFIESVFWLPASKRIFLTGIAGLSFIGILAYFGYPAFNAWTGRDKRFSFDSSAKKVGNNFPEIKDKILNALQLFSQIESNKGMYSSALALESMNVVGKDFGKYNFNQSIDYGQVKKHGYQFLIFLLFPLFLWLLSSGGISHAMLRLLSPTKTYPIPVSFSLSVNPGNTELLRNDPFSLNVGITGKDPDKLFLYTRDEGENEYEEHPLEKNETGAFTFTINRVKNTFSYFIKAEERSGFLKRRINSLEYKATVINRPLVRKLKLHLDYPDYSQLENRYLEDNIGDVTALKGTEVDIEIAINKAVTEADIVFFDGKTLPIKVNGMKGSAKLIVDKNTRYTISLKDEQGVENSDPIEYRITAVEDEFPFVQFLSPGEDTDLTEDKQQPLALRVNDDFGVSALRLAFTVIDPDNKSSVASPDSITKLLADRSKFSFTTIPLQKTNGIAQDVFFLWDLKDTQLFPEDRILYFAEVRDNDRISGPKRSRTRTYLVRFPSLEELFASTTKQQEEQQQDISEIIEDSQKLKEKLEEISREFKTAKQLEYEQTKKAEDAIKQQENLNKKVDEIEKEIEDMVNTFEKNDLLSAKTLDKYKELQELWNELSPEELNEAMQKLRDSLQNNSKIADQNRNLDNFQQAQEDFLKKVERTLNILKRLQIEQMMDEVVIKSENIAETQEAVNAQIDSLDKKNQDNKSTQGENRKLSRQEKNLSKSMDNLQETTEDLAAKMAEQSDMSTEKINRSLQMMNENRTSEKMQEMSQNLEKSNTEQAQQQGKEIQKDLEQLEDSMKDAQQQLTEEQKKQIVQGMQKSAFDLLNLSMMQESLKSKSNDLTTNSNEFEKTADNQNNLISGLAKTITNLVRISEKSFFITPELTQQLSSASESMKNSIQGLEVRNKQASVKQQQTAMQSLNEAVMELQNAVNNAKQSGSGVGFEEFLKRMEEMSGQQSGVNQQSLDLSQGGKLTQEQQAAMQRLMQEQEMIKKSMEQLQEELQNRQNLNQRLGELSSNMDEVVNELRNQNVDERTLQLQERILSRMLDAQKSLHRRDFSNKREAVQAKEYDAVSPGQLPAGLGESQNSLEEILSKALKDGYSRDFEDLIKKYFESLGKKGKKN